MLIMSISAYVAGHPMKPHRIRLAHSLIMNYSLSMKMEIYVSTLGVPVKSNLSLAPHDEMLWQSFSFSVSQ